MPKVMPIKLRSSHPEPGLHISMTSREVSSIGVALGEAGSGNADAIGCIESKEQWRAWRPASVANVKHRRHVREVARQRQRVPFFLAGLSVENRDVLLHFVVFCRVSGPISERNGVLKLVWLPRGRSQSALMAPKRKSVAKARAWSLRTSRPTVARLRSRS